MAAQAAVLTPVGLLLFPQLFVPKPPVPGGQDRYSCNLSFSPEGQATQAYATLRKAAGAAAADKWGPQKLKDKNFMARMRSPFRPADEKADKYAGFHSGDVFISAWSKFQPEVVDFHAQKITDPKLIFAGQLARMSVTAFAYENAGNYGVSFSLQSVQIVKADMPRLDGRKSASEVYGSDTTDLSAYGPTSPLSGAGAAAFGAGAGGSSGGTPFDDIPF